MNTDPTSSYTCKCGVTKYRSVKFKHRNHEETDQQHMIKPAIKQCKRGIAVAMHSRARIELDIAMS